MTFKYGWFGRPRRATPTEREQRAQETQHIRTTSTSARIAGASHETYTDDDVLAWMANDLTGPHPGGHPLSGYPMTECFAVLARTVQQHDER